MQDCDYNGNTLGLFNGDLLGDVKVTLLGLRNGDFSDNQLIPVDDDWS